MPPHRGFCDYPKIIEDLRVLSQMTVRSQRSVRSPVGRFPIRFRVNWSHWCNELQAYAEKRDRYARNVRDSIRQKGTSVVPGSASETSGFKRSLYLTVNCMGNTLPDVLKVSVRVSREANDRGRRSQWLKTIPFRWKMF
jgi:hypothetical protein